jgi:hypothetical protein
MLEWIHSPLKEREGDMEEEEEEEEETRVTTVAEFC